MKSYYVCSVLTVTACVTNAIAQIGNDGQSCLVGSYQFETGVPGQAAGVITDSSSLGIHGTGINGPIYSSDVHVAAPCNGVATLISLSFNGADQAVQMDGVFPFNTSSDASLLFWLKSPFDSHGAVVFANTGGISGFQFFTNGDGTFGFNYREPGGALHCLGYCNPSDGIPVPRNQWTHLAIVRRSDIYSVYENGSLVATQIDVNPAPSGANGWGISTRPGYPFHGLIDDVRVYSCALSPSDFFLDPIADRPASTTACASSDSSFSINAYGTGPLNYRWQWRRLGQSQWFDVVQGINSDGSASFQSTGGVSATVDVSNYQEGGVSGLTGPRAEFSCVVSNACGSVTSDAATLSICYANCDCSTGSPSLTASDFTCFLSRFRAGDAYANCDGSTGTPLLTASDFACFLNAFRAGCP